MASRYDELAKLAIKNVQLLHEVKLACQAAAEALSQAIADYFGSPDERLQYQDVRPDMSLGQVRWPVRGRALFDLTGGGDGFYYFALRHSFIVAESSSYFSHSTTIFGIRQAGDLFGIRLRGEKEREINVDDESAVTALCEFLYEQYRQHFTAPVSGPPRQIGFIGGS